MRYMASDMQTFPGKIGFAPLEFHLIFLKEKLAFVYILFAFINVRNEIKPIQPATIKLVKRADGSLVRMVQINQPGKLYSTFYI